MPPGRPRRAAAQKQRQYRFDDESETSTLQSHTSSQQTPKKKYGGVLASLSHNVNVSKTTNNNNKTNKDDNKSERSEAGGDSTPKRRPMGGRDRVENTPPPSSVMIGAMTQVFSPPTSVIKQRGTPSRHHFDNAGADDGVSAMSCDIASPAISKIRRPNKNEDALEKNATVKPLEVDEDDDDDDKTMEMITPRSSAETACGTETNEKNFVDPNETILEDEEDEESDEDEQEDDEDEEEDDDEEEEEDASEPDLFDDEESEEEDDYESEDDEYVPDDDDESLSEDELSDFVVNEVKPTRGRRPKRQATKKEDPTTRKSKAGNSKQQKQKFSTPEPKTPPSVPTDSPVTPAPFDDDDATEIENTPARNILRDLGSPEPAEAMVLDDEDVDEDDDVLVATIISDDNDTLEGTEALAAILDGDTGCDGEVEADDAKSVANFEQNEDVGTEVGSVVSVETDYPQQDEERSTATKVQEQGQVVNSGEMLGKSEARDGEAKQSIFRRMSNDTENSTNSKENRRRKASEDEDSLMISSSMQNAAAGSAHGLVDSARAANSKSADMFSTPKDKGKRRSFYRKEGKVKRGKWSLGSKIGVGSFGVVHVGMNTLDGTLMAVKRFKMNGAVTKDIRREIELLRSLEHKNIVRYLGAEMDKKHLHIFQEWVPGGSVASLLAKFGPFSVQVIRSYLSQTLAGLAYLHENDIMHRDIKGSNILVNDEGIVKLADFGASKKLANLQDNLMMSMTVRGTPYFMAPEVFEEKYSAKADIWGIGCVAYQMITGNPPWKDKGFSNPISLFNHIKSHDGPPPMDVREDELATNQDRRIRELFDVLVGKCFQQDPSVRPTAPELLEESFFIEMHDDADDDASQYRGIFSPGGLFSPGNESMASLELSRSPDSPLSSRSPGTPFSATSPCGDSRLMSPSPLKHTRSKSVSVVQWKTSFLSPPRPQRNGRAKGSPSPARSTKQPMSPQPDTSGWPEWARSELRKASPGNTDTSKAENDPRDLSALMGSLALSEDGSSVGPNPFARGSGNSIASVEKSHLVGLNLLDKSNSTYEI